MNRVCHEQYQSCQSTILLPCNSYNTLLTTLTSHMHLHNLLIATVQSELMELSAIVSQDREKKYIPLVCLSQSQTHNSPVHHPEGLPPTEYRYRAEHSPHPAHSPAIPTPSLRRWQKHRCLCLSR
jgi:hypothetical protein